MQLVEGNSSFQDVCLSNKRSERKQMCFLDVTLLIVPPKILSQILPPKMNFLINVAIWVFCCTPCLSAIRGYKFSSPRKKTNKVSPQIRSGLNIFTPWCQSYPLKAYHSFEQKIIFPHSHTFYFYMVVFLTVPVADSLVIIVIVRLPLSPVFFLF